MGTIGTADTEDRHSNHRIRYKLEER